MRTCRAPLFILLSFLLSCGCQPQNEGDFITAEAAIASINSRISQWYAEGRIDSLTQLYADDGIIFVPNAPPIKGLEAIRDYKQRMLTGVQWDVTLMTKTIQAEGSQAVEHGSYLITITFPGDMDPITDRGNYVNVWRRRGSEWMIQYDISTSEMPRSR